MLDPDKPDVVEGDHLGGFVGEVKREFFARSACTSFAGLSQPNTLRVVAIDVFDCLAPEAQVAALADLFLRNDEIVVRREAADVFVASDAPAAFMTDLLCEVVWQLLSADPAVQMEDEARAALPGL